MSDPTTTTTTNSTATPAKKTRVWVESHCIGCNTCVYICDSVFELGVGATEEQKSHVKDDAPIEECAEKIDEAIQMCPVTAIFKE